MFTFSWPRFGSRRLRNGGTLREEAAFCLFAVDGIPIEMYGESWIAGSLTSEDIILYMAGFGTTQGLQWCLLRSRSMNYAEVIIALSAANST